MDRIEIINKYINSVNLMPVDIDPIVFGEDFDPSTLDFGNADREKNRESVLKVLRKIVDLSNSNLKKNAGCLLATEPYINKDILWVGRKRVPEDKFALSY